MLILLESRAEIFGATYMEQRADEERYPFLRHWAGRHGVAPDRWKAWRAAGRPAADRSALSIVGEQAIVDAFRSMLAQLPDPVAWFLVRHVVVVCGGQEAAGSWSALPMLPPAPPAERHLIQLHVADESTAAHECRHAWTMDPPEFRSRLTAARCEELAAKAVGLTVLQRDLEAWEREHNQHERAADRLASLWLGREVDTTSGACGERRRQAMERDVSRLLERARAIDGTP